VKNEELNLDSSIKSENVPPQKDDPHQIDSKAKSDVIQVDPNNQMEDLKKVKGNKRDKCLYLIFMRIS